jgi:anti-sigma B factor antagonist
MTDLARFRITVASDGCQSYAGNESETTLLEVAGEIDIATSSRLRQQLEVLLLSGRAVTVDMSNVEFIDASGIGVLLDAASQATAAGIEIMLRSPSRRVLRVMELLELDGLLPVEKADSSS